MSTAETLILYICVVIGGAGIMALSRKVYVDNSGNRNIEYGKTGLIVTFLIMWFLIAFTDIGADRDEYIRILNYASFDHIFYCEFGLNILFIIGKMLFYNNPGAVIFFVRTLSLLIFFKAFWNMKSKINLSLSIFLFGALFYLRFYLIAMYVSCAVIFLATSYLLEGKSRAKALFWFVIACTLHYGAILLLPTVLLIGFDELSHKRKLRLVFKVFIISIYLVSLIALPYIFDFAITNIPVFKGYQIYGMITNSSSSGLYNYILFIPVFIMVYDAAKNIKDQSFNNKFFIISVSAFFIALVGYQLEVASRMSYFYYVVQIMYIPQYMALKRQNSGIIKHGRIEIKNAVIILYLVITSVQVFLVTFNTPSALISEWQFYWPF